jgi:membrane AbrB-like protein
MTLLRLWWPLIFATSLGLGWGLLQLGVPGSWLVGALIVALPLGLGRPATFRVRSVFLLGAQAAIGVQLGAGFRPEVFPSFVAHLPAITAVMVVTLGVSLAAGVVLSRVTSLSRETATLGTLPGGASSMIAVSLETGGDTKMIALMQYLRMIIVVLASSFVAALLAPGVNPHPAAVPAVPASWVDYAATPLMAALGVVLGRVLRVPAGAFLGPIALSITASSLGLFHPVWPVWVVPSASVLMGLYVGFLFDRPSLVKAGKLLPVLVVNTLVLIACCGVAGLVFAWTAGATPLSGYLSASPGGMDSIAVIALGTGADLSLILTVQTVRLIVILFTGPVLAKTVLKMTRPGGPHV